MPVEKLTLDPSYGNGAVPTGSYTRFVGDNYKRRWFSITVPPTEADSMLLVLAREADFVSNLNYAQIYMAPGTSIVLSMSGDMPWQGAIYGTGVVGDSYCYWSEVEDYP